LSSARFYQMLQVTIVYTVASVVGTVVIALLAALFMNRPFPGIGLVRALITIPWAAPDVAIVLIFVWIFNNQYGVANYFLTQLGIVQTYQRWLDNPALALPAVLFVTIWKIFPFSALVLLAALQSIPDELFEAARVDGADQLNIFKNVMLPWISPTLAVVTLLITIWSLRRFSILWLLTQGGPVLTTNTLVIDLYRESFKSLHLGYGAAIGVIGLLLSLVVTGVYFLVTQRAEAQGGS
jgi:multiple sugar transport system permease protein